jgi:hypothetical protein
MAECSQKNDYEAGMFGLTESSTYAAASAQYGRKHGQCRCKGNYQRFTVFAPFGNMLFERRISGTTIIFDRRYLHYAPPDMYRKFYL